METNDRETDGETEAATRRRHRRKEVEKLARRSLDPNSTDDRDGLDSYSGVTDERCKHQQIRNDYGSKAMRPPDYK